MSATLIAVALSLVSAGAYASAAVAQSRLAGRTDPSAGVLRLLGLQVKYGHRGINQPVQDRT
ncbi:hypothetical protein I3W98_32555, partial [Streptomyces cavourensis]|nr:hypothetical protein [Streptomyces cavourensis]